MSKTLVISGKRKSSVARATIRDGKGKVTVNNTAVDAVTPLLVRERIKEPLTLAAEHLKKVDIELVTSGGGQTAQAEAARLATAKALVLFTKDKKLKESYLNYDRHLLVADVRRKETRKPNCQSSARSKRQKSYR